MSASYDLGSFVGFDYPDEEVSWNRRDTILYALSIGAHKDDFNLVYEKDPKFQVFPTFATTLSFKGTDTDVFDFATKFSKEAKPPGFPPLNPATLVQASQYYENLAPIPPVSTAGFRVTKKIVGVHEASDGVTFDNEITLVGPGPDNKKYARMIAQAKYLGGVANGVPFNKVQSNGFPTSPPIATLGRPKWTAVGPTWETQSILYRLNGDYNPLHIDPAVGKKLGYGGLILHGLGMYSITARAIVEKLSGGNPANLKALTALFSGPITPGDDLQISIWDLGPGPDGVSTSIAFEARNGKGSLCLGEGHAYVIKTTVLPEKNPKATAFDPSAIKNGDPPAPVVPANGPKLNTNYGPLIAGIPIKTLIPVLFFSPLIIANLLYVTLSYWLTWWWQW